jgi:DNA-binding response OmpR family regulator
LKGTIALAKILIIEDDRQTAEYVGQHLTAAGHQCALEASGEQAFTRVQQEATDLVILDIMLPDTSGFEICRRIRRDTELYTLPVLVLTAMNNEEEVLHGLAQGADDYVVKPFNITNLVQRVEALLRASVDSDSPDGLTGLPGTDSVKREIQRRISRRETFSLAYSELMNLREFAYRFGGDVRAKAIRHIARALVKEQKSLKDEAAYVGHMGGGHFVCMVPGDKVDRFADRVCARWKEHLEGFYTSLGHSGAYHEATRENPPPDALPLLDVLFCVTTHDKLANSTPQQIFEVLGQIRAKALEKKQGGVHRDHRRR